MIQAIEIKSVDLDKIPEFYIGFSDDLKEAERRIQSESTLKAIERQGMEVLLPHRLYRIAYMSETPKPHYILAFELRQKEQ